MPDLCSRIHGGNGLSHDDASNFIGDSHLGQIVDYCLFKWFGFPNDDWRLVIRHYDNHHNHHHSSIRQLDLDQDLDRDLDLNLDLDNCLF
ncbi:hypothetical protein MNV49_000016 [Pseudohyphozyma bogoriensis]|nr:hypothetical protein MNV49_000016 [Pseudohyphozyma bogoriensis]